MLDTFTFVWLLLNGSSGVALAAIIGGPAGPKKSHAVSSVACLRFKILHGLICLQYVPINAVVSMGRRNTQPDRSLY